MHKAAHEHLAEAGTSFLVLVFGSSGCSGIGSVRFGFGMWARGSLLLVYTVSDFTVIFSNSIIFTILIYYLNVYKGIGGSGTPFSNRSFFIVYNILL